ncbi:MULTISPECIES: helix-turn-helix domain-containing protein [unclassified Polaribacter]|uniref:helix-turn-helix domain-containing protein n=1 Tax=unclassified Polaribacter TaxID=196858 RepID=UPI0011BF0B31|nr:MULTISPECIES: helix-turn-helix transcriptional regulator [unclassified Polaribacter]TXD52702.1 helix-turn-helix domain-containing protein [Polaribacter sp. IC063]TXD60670.1 helix-turn-helix domain-containing protein [Polaribacter sp. IC066]
MNVFSIEKNPREVAKELAIKFKKLRNEAKLTRKELAERSGVSESSIKRFETTGLISLISLLKISQILKKLEDFQTLFKNDDANKIKELFSDKMNL